MKGGDFEATIEGLNLTKREAKELRQLVFRPPISAVNEPPIHLGPRQWAKALLVVALVLALGIPLGYGIFLVWNSEWVRIWESFAPLIIAILAINNLYQAVMRGRIVRKLYDVLQICRRPGITEELV